MSTGDIDYYGNYEYAPVIHLYSCFNNSIGIGRVVYPAQVVVDPTLDFVLALKKLRNHGNDLLDRLRVGDMQTILGNVVRLYRRRILGANRAMVEPDNAEILMEIDEYRKRLENALAFYSILWYHSKHNSLDLWTYETYYQHGTLVSDAHIKLLTIGTNRPISYVIDIANGF